MKHLLEGDLTKRYGNLKGGVADIKTHRFYKGFDWEKMNAVQLQMPYLPKVKNSADISNFSSYPDSDKVCAAVKKGDDPFLEWFS